MIKAPRVLQRTLLILKGVSRDELKTSVVEITTESLYSPLPRRFESLEKWPESSNLRCWHCDLVIGDHRPAFVPLSFDINLGEYQCNTLGVFNRWGCVIAYIDYTYSGQKREQARQIAKLMCSKILGRQITYIAPAPPRTTMLPYGGEMSESEYLASIPI